MCPQISECLPGRDDARYALGRKSGDTLLVSEINRIVSPDLCPRISPGFPLPAGNCFLLAVADADANPVPFDGGVFEATGRTPTSSPTATT